MIGEIASEFENITKFNLLDYLVKYRDFLQNDYSDVYNYFAGISETIDANKLNKLTDLISKSNDLIRTFHTFAGKLGNVGYWELQRYCQDLRDTLERINKFPKYCRTAKTSRGYKPYVQVEGEIGGLKTMKDFADELGGTVSEEELLLNNDLQEQDYEIDKLHKVNALVNNSNDIVVTTILEQPIGRKIYGRDIDRKITFKDNDLSVVEYEDNVEQKCQVLLELNKGDVPEYPNFGKNITLGEGVANYNYAELMLDLQENFEQDDLFESVRIVDISTESLSGDIQIKVEINTKYAYSTTQTITL